MKTDLELQKDVIEELKWESFINSSEIGVSVKDGVVTLSGSVDSYNKKRIAEQAAMRVLGVKAVAEDITVKLGSSFTKTDAEIAQAALNALKWHSSIDEDRIKLKVDNGWVTIEGSVDWTFEKNAIRMAIENLTGVKGISNLVLISPKVNVNANEVKQKISAAFHRSATIDADNIIISNIGNKVILSGSVRSYAEKQDAERAVWNLPGIVSIENNLEVKVPVLFD